MKNKYNIYQYKMFGGSLRGLKTSIERAAQKREALHKQRVKKV